MNSLKESSEFNVWYLDDATLGDSPERVYDDLVVLLERLRAIGLEVNWSKCELTILNDSMPEATEALFRGLLPGVRVVEACDLSLLGAPVEEESAWENDIKVVGAEPISSICFAEKCLRDT